MLRFSSWEGEEDQNAAWLWLNIFNKDDNVNNIHIQNKKMWKNRNSPNWCKTQRQETITHKIPKEYGCLNMVPNQRQ